MDGTEESRSLIDQQRSDELTSLSILFEEIKTRLYSRIQEIVKNKSELIQIELEDEIKKMVEAILAQYLTKSVNAIVNINNDSVEAVVVLPLPHAISFPKIKLPC